MGVMMVPKALNTNGSKADDEAEVGPKLDRVFRRGRCVLKEEDSIIVQSGGSEISH